MSYTDICEMMRVVASVFGADSSEGYIALRYIEIAEKKGGDAARAAARRLMHQTSSISGARGAAERHILQAAMYKPEAAAHQIVAALAKHRCASKGAI